MLSPASQKKSPRGVPYCGHDNLYMAVARPAITYGSTVWHILMKSKSSPSRSNENCQQYKIDAYEWSPEHTRLTPVGVLEAERCVPSMLLHLKQLQVKSRYCLRSVGHAKLVTKACQGIAAKL